MKIRDIQAYLKGRCPNCSLEKLGTDDEPFLETIYGQDQETYEAMYACIQNYVCRLSEILNEADEIIV